MKKRIILCALVMVLFFSLDVNAASKFSDVKETAWYYKYLSPLVDAKIIDGMPDGTFKGNNTLNTDQLLKLMVTTINPNAPYLRTMGYKMVNGVKKYQPMDPWFETYLNTLVSMSIISPEKAGKASDYNKPITREEVAYWIEQGFSFLRVKNQPYDETALDEIKSKIATWYNDANTIDDKYLKSIYILHETGIMEGGDDGGFWPKKVLTRAEATAVIYRLQKARNVEMGKNNLDFKTDTARKEEVWRVNADGTKDLLTLVVKNGYVYSSDGMGETDKAAGIGISQVTVKDIDLTDFPLVDGADTPEWGEDEIGFSDAFKEELRKQANMD